MGLWGNILKIGGMVGAGVAAPFTGGASLALLPSLIGAGGAAAGGIADAMANNRGEKFGGQIDLERVLLDRERQLQDMQIARETEGRTGGKDAWRRLLAAQHALNPVSAPAASYRDLPIEQPSATTRQGATAMSDEVMKRLLGGNPIPEVTQHELGVDPKLLDGSKWETVLGALGAGGQAYGALETMRRGDDTGILMRNRQRLKQQTSILPALTMRPAGL